MAIHVYGQQNAQKNADSAPEQNLFQPRPFAVQRQSSLASPEQQETPDLQTQLERAERFGHNFGRVQVEADTPAVMQRQSLPGQSQEQQYQQETDGLVESVKVMAPPILGKPMQQEVEQDESIQMPPQLNILTPAIQRQDLEEEPIQMMPQLGYRTPAIQREEQEDSPIQMKLIQLKPALGQLEDTYEQEANPTAQRVMSMSTAPANSVSIQRQGEEEEKEPSVQRLPLVQQTGKQVQIDRKQISPPHTRTEKDWYEGDMIHWAREINNLPNTKNTFVRAAIFNTQNYYPEEYTTIAQRSAYYDVIDALAATGMLPKKIRFFGAASQVTGKNSVGSIEGAIGWSLHSKEAIKILKDVNEILLQSNMKVINKLMSTKGKPTDPRNPDSNDTISAIQFDLNMVQVEQGIVENYLNKELNKIPDKARTEAIKDINDDLNFKGFWRTLGEYTLADAKPIEWAKKALGIDKLDFMQRTHREAIGKALVLSLHKNTLGEYLSYMKDGIVPSDKLPEDYRGPFSMSISPK